MADGRPAPAGSLIKLAPLSLNDVPTHPDLRNFQATAPQVHEFIEDVFSEAQTMTFTQFDKIGVLKDSVSESGTSFPFEVEKLKFKEKGSAGTVWFARRSTHESGKPVGFEELDGIVRKEHEINEMRYTPNIYEANTLVEWKEDLITKMAKGVEIRLTQMHHSMPKPLSDRVFTALVITGQISPTESIDMQLPVDLSTFPPNIKARSHANKLTYTLPSDSSIAFNDTQKTKDGKKLVEGKYVSLERLTKVKDAEDGKEVTRWEMMTASDAGGYLPGFVQNMGVPGAIAKDVGLALKYIVEQRGGQE